MPEEAVLKTVSFESGQYIIGLGKEENGFRLSIHNMDEPLTSYPPEPNYFIDEGQARSWALWVLGLPHYHYIEGSGQPDGSYRVKLP